MKYYYKIFDKRNHDKYNYKYSFFNFINYNWKLRKQFNYYAKKRNEEKIKNLNSFNQFKTYERMINTNIN